MAAQARAIIFASVKNSSNFIARSEIDRQVQVCTKRARRMGLPIHGIYREMGVYTNTPLSERPVLREALDAMTAQDHLVVATSAQLSRRSCDVIRVVAHIIRAKGELVFVSETVESADEIRAAVAELSLATMQSLTR